jgi:hypothetical protein
MSTIKTFFLLAGLICFSANAQTEEPQPAIDSAVETEPGIEAPPPPPVMEMLEETVEAEEYPYGSVEEAPMEYSPLNRFKHNGKIKAQTATDKRAYYSEGIVAMLSFISTNLSIPYRYERGGDPQIVLIRVIVGKDSALYNPEFLTTQRSQFSVNAQEVIEQLPARFIPATKNGKAVDSYLIIPIRFENTLNLQSYHSR